MGRKELEAKIATLSVQRGKLETDVTFAKEDMQRAQKEIDVLHEKAFRLEEAEAEIDLLRNRFEETENNFNSERENFNQLLLKSQEEIVSLAKDYEMFNTQLLEKDEQVQQLLDIKEQRKNFIEENQSLKKELQIQYEKLNKRNEKIGEDEKDL